MAMSFNRVILVGNLTRDPEVRYTSTGLAVCEFSLAINDRRRASDGTWTDETSFFDITLWQKQAETASQYLSKGSSVLIEGRLKQDRWEQDGQKRSKIFVVGERMQMLGSRGGSSRDPDYGSGSSNYGGSSSGGYDDASPSGRPAGPARDSNAGGNTSGDMRNSLDDIPF